MDGKELKLSLYRKDIVDFFGSSNLGKIASTDQPLTSVLYFTQPIINGMENPLYRITGHRSASEAHPFADLFALYAFYNNMLIPNTTRIYKATPDMKNALRELILLTTDSIGIEHLNYPFARDQIEMIRRRQIRCLDTDWTDPTPWTIHRVCTDIGQSIMNPDYISVIDYYHIIKVASISNLSNDDMDELIPDVTRTYQFLFPEYDEITPTMVYDYQRKFISSAVLYKYRGYKKK